MGHLSLIRQIELFCCLNPTSVYYLCTTIALVNILDLDQETHYHSVHADNL